MPGTPKPFTPIPNMNGSYSGSMSSVGQSTIPQQALGPNGQRNGIFLYNDTNVGNCLVAFGVTASLSQYTNKLAPSGSWLLPTAPVYCGPIYVVWDSGGSGSLRVTETV